MHVVIAMMVLAGASCLPAASEPPSGADLGSADGAGNDADGATPPFEGLPRYRMAVPLEDGTTMRDGGVALVEHVRAAWSADVSIVDVSEPGPSADLGLIVEADPPNADLAFFGTAWHATRTPTITVGAALFEPMRLMTGQPTSARNPTVEVVEDGSRIAAGLTRSLLLYGHPDGSVSTRAERAPGARVVVSYTATDQQVHEVVQVVDEGGELTDGGTSAAPRIALGAADAQWYSPRGWQLFDNLVGEAVQEALPATRGQCTLLVGNDDPRELRVATRARRLGCVVTVAEELTGNEDVVIVAPSVSVVTFNELERPVVVLFDGTSALSGLRLFRGERFALSQSTWAVSPDASPALVGDASDTVTVARVDMPLAGVPVEELGDDVQVLASLGSAMTYATYFYAPAGAMLVDGEPASGDRIAIGLGSTLLNEGTPEVFDLLDAAINWAIVRSSQ